eukprot:2613589-Prymnesium_polylepis.1
MPKQTFAESSQARHWMFSVEQIAQMRVDASSAAAGKLRASLEVPQSATAQPSAVGQQRVPTPQAAPPAVSAGICRLERELHSGTAT